MKDRLFGPYSYKTYPHSNGFTRDGRFIVLGWLSQNSSGITKVDLTSGEETPLWQVPASVERGLWFDLAVDADVLTAVFANAVWDISLDGSQEPRCIYEAEPGMELQDLVSIRRDGSAVLAGFAKEKRCGCLEIDVASGRAQVLFSVPWWADHFHYCPHDESWIGFAHEGKATEVTDRTWAWHAELAPEGCVVFPQRAPNGGNIAVGHEVWNFYSTSALTVAYGESAEGPRGIYELYADGRPPRLISEGQRDLHCHASRDGRLAVVDTTGPVDAPGRGWENAGRVCDIQLIDMETGRRRSLARTGELAHLSERGPGHPYHAHPTFTPDGTAVVFNDWVQEGEKVVPAARLLSIV